MNLPPTIEQAADALAAGNQTPTELVDGCLRRIESWDREVRAWVVIDAEGARRQAQRAGEELTAGQRRGPLHGIPIGIKDIINVAGMPTRAGSELTPADAVEEDAPVVARLREAGAVILGKTVTTEFACFDPPPTRNPWNQDHTPGGSSSGSAAAVACGMCVAAVGSQTGGSITRPASYCGIAGLKPSYDRVSREGVIAVSPHLDHVGPLARGVADLAHMLSAMVGEDFSSPLGGAASRGDFRIGLLRSFFFDRADEAVQAATEAALEQLRSAGVGIGEAQLPDSFEDVHQMHRRIMARDVAAVRRERFAKSPFGFGENVASLIQEGMLVTDEDYEEARRHQAQFQEEIPRSVGDFDALLTPATPSPAPGLSTTGNPGFNSPWSYGGLPTVSVPCGLTASGLPVAVQLIGRRNEEAPLLAVAAACESVFGFKSVPPLVAGS